MKKGFLCVVLRRLSCFFRELRGCYLPVKSYPVTARPAIRIFLLIKNFLFPPTPSPQGGIRVKNCKEKNPVKGWLRRWNGF